MPKKPETKTHQLHHTEEPLGVPQALSSLSKGDVFVRNGTPCMVAAVADTFPADKCVFIVNLTNGSVWSASGSDPVYPAYNVKLQISTTRRETDAS